MKLNPPKRKNTSEIVSEGEHACGDKKFFRRDYIDGSVDLITYVAAKGYWLYETYVNKKILGMEYDFEYCLSDPLFRMLYFKSATVIYERPHRKNMA